MPLVLDNCKKDLLTPYILTDFRVYNPLGDGESFHRESVSRGDGEYVDGDVHVNTHKIYAPLARRWLSPY
jgi:transposase